MTEQDLMEQLLTLSSLISGYDKHDTIMIDKGFRDARVQSMIIVKDYLLRKGLLIDEVVEMEESEFDLTEEDFFDLEKSITEINVL